jgi:hypothetical protein
MGRNGYPDAGAVVERDLCRRLESFDWNNRRVLGWGVRRPVLYNRALTRQEAEHVYAVLRSGEGCECDLCREGQRL